MARAVDRNRILMDIGESKQHAWKTAEMQPVKASEKYVLHLAYANAAE